MRNGSTPQAHATSARYTLPMPAATVWSSSATPVSVAGSIASESADDLVQVRACLTQVRSERGEHGMARELSVRKQLDHGRGEADGVDVGRADRDHHAPHAPPPSFSGAVEMPRPAHAHMGVQREPAGPDQQVLATRTDAIDALSGPRNGVTPPARASQTWCLEPHDHRAVEHPPERGSRAVDRVALGHDGRLSLGA